MPHDRVIQTFEHEELRIGDTVDGVAITVTDRDLLSRLHRQTAGAFFDLIDRGIKFKNFVGVLKAGTLVIEILPKGDRGAKRSLDPAQKLPWRSLVVHLLSRIGFIPTDLGPRSAVFLQHGSLIDLYVLHFTHAVRELCHEGLVRTYIPRLKTRPALKGQIQFQRQLIHELRGTVGFDTRAAEYERGHPLNRLLRTTLDALKSTRLSALTYDHLPELLAYFEDVPPLTDPLPALNNLRYDRRTERYRPAIDLAKPILLSAHPGVRAGVDETFSMFFDMNLVWERYIFAELRRHAATRGITVDRQVVAPLWEGRTVRPDIVVYLSPTERIVIDTKWKELKHPHPSDHDLRQMFTYNHQIDAIHSILLYPDIHGLQAKGGEFISPAGQRTHGCTVDFARIWSITNSTVALNHLIGAEVLGMVERVVARSSAGITNARF